MGEALLDLSTEPSGKCQIYFYPPFVCLSRFARRRQHRRLATQVLTPKAMQGFAAILDYESHILVKSLYEEGQKGQRPINPANYCGRFALKLV